ncbi:hypothetical protein BKA62DRAFT_410154 [Auriculariales sp. MPI-PUGE-AT-0066]|nr:hypothetical protein BKA62DRAFT_410154 [Auriculariales sp. MPI-PUGE-AT-0066]
MSSIVAPVIREVTPGVVIFSVPFKLGLIPFGGRSTAIQLSTGDVWLMASHQPEETTRSALASLGRVRYIVSAAAGHNFYLAAYKSLYPDALVIGVDGQQEKLASQGVKLDGVYFSDASETKYGFEDEIASIPFYGHSRSALAFYHTATKSLVQADLLFNLPARESFSAIKQTGSIPLLTSQFKPGAFLHQQTVSGFIVDKGLFKRASDQVLSLDMERIIPCHGDVLERSKGDDPHGKWELAYRFL